MCVIGGPAALRIGTPRYSDESKSLQHLLYNSGKILLTPRARTREEVPLAGTTKFWLAVGTPTNWHTAFDYGGIWGLRRTQRHYWESIAENTDLVFFYVTTPVAGVVGHGIVRTKLHQPSPLWPEERAKNEVIWPLRFEFDVLTCLPPHGWAEQKVTSVELKARARSGFQSLDAATATDLIRALPAQLPRGLVLTARGDDRSRPATFPTAPPAPMPADAHGRTQWQIAEIGRLQKFMTETEYPIENRRLDVVWRRVQRSVPSYVFEVQVSGNLTEGVGKLKQAYDLWNSNIFLVGREEHRQPVSQLLAATFREIEQRLRFIELAQVEELYQSKRAYRDLESQLGILL